MSKKRAFLTPQNEPDGEVCIRLILPSGGEWSDLARGALALLLSEENWEEIGIAIDETVQIWQEALRKAFEWEACVPVGGIIMWAGAFDAVPDGWLLCDGSPVAIDDYPGLYEVIGDTFGASAAGLFTLPSMTRRFPLGFGIPGAVGDFGGSETVMLDESEMPIHHHQVESHSHSLDGMTLLPLQSGAGQGYGPSPFPESTGGAAPGTNDAGGGAAHDNMPPYLTLNFIVRAE